tara:strand:+ start:71 stop:919 length:849 start_codon:yes stop_codon:yes gene_type:complete
MVALTKVTGQGIDNVTVDSNGKVGIGTTSPQELLHINDSGSPTIRLTNSTTGTGSGDGSEIMIADADNTLRIINHEAAHIRFDANSSERMRIDSTGGVRVGTTTNILNAASNEKMSVKNTGQGHAASFQITNVSGGFPILYLDSQDTANTNQNTIAIRRGNSQVGGITTNASATAFNTVSDHRLKENVADMTDAIARVKQLAPKRFNFIADADTTVDGFLAHEAQTVVPEAVTGTHNEVDSNGNAVMQGIDQGKLVPLLTAALKESVAKIEALEARVAALEA